MGDGEKCHLERGVKKRRSRLRYGYTSTQNRSIFCCVKLRDRIKLLLFVSFRLRYCLSLPEKLNQWRHIVISGILVPTEPLTKALVGTEIDRYLPNEQVNPYLNLDLKYATQ